MPSATRPARLPKNYQLVYEILQAAGCGVHLSTHDVFTRAKRRRPTIGFSTVYRGVQRLADLSLIDEIAVPGADRAVYELTGVPHAHFRCDRCGVVQDVAYRLSSKTIAALAKKTGARIDETMLTLSGRCRACRKLR
jgi:Fe2+ or Zn2+ uptake regulation protein